MSEGLWIGNRYIKEESELARECQFCGYCGARMKQIIHPHPLFNRATGIKGQCGDLFWECPKRGLGIEALIHSDWGLEYEENPHDSVFLRKV